MPVDKKKLVKQAEILDKVHGDGTEAFLDELVNDEFSEWQLSDAKKKSPVTKANENDNQCKLKEFLPSVTNKDPKPVQSEPQKGDELLREAKSKQVKFSTSQPQRKWTRFPTREPAVQDKPSDKPVGKITSAIKPVKNHRQPKAGSTCLLDIGDTTQFLDYLLLEPDDWGVGHKKMETFLLNFRCDGREKEVNMDHERRRRGSSSSLESTATSGSSSYEEQNIDYLSARTEEEMVACKMEDIKQKLNNNIRDNWMDDVELALLLMKRKSGTRALRSSEIKYLLKDILQHK